MAQEPEDKSPTHETARKDALRAQQGAATIAEQLSLEPLPKAAYYLG